VFLTQFNPENKSYGEGVWLQILKNDQVKVLLMATHDFKVCCGWTSVQCDYFQLEKQVIRKLIGDGHQSVIMLYDRVWISLCCLSHLQLCS
jgi:hypothetical protein